MIGVVGLGFVGLTTSLGFADHGITTMGYDIDEAKVSDIVNGKIPFYEPGLREALQRNLNRNFTIASSLSQLVENSKVIFVCVGTPEGRDGSADLSFMKRAFESISENTKSGEEKLILIKSTVPPSTTDSMQEFVNTMVDNEDKRIIVGTNPEFLREGHAWDDFVNPDRIVVGLNNKPMQNIVRSIYKNFDSPITFTEPRTAEFLKYLSNTLLSTLISFSNEMSVIARKIGGIDIPEAFRLLHMDKRFYGEPSGIISYIYPGCGYGGYCLPKDTLALSFVSRQYGFNPVLIDANLAINDNIMGILLEDFFKLGYEKSVPIGILGLAFKPESDDVRSTPALHCIQKLLDNGYTNIMVHDPKAMENFRRTYHELNVQFIANAVDMINTAKVVFIVTARSNFSELDFSGKEVFDLRYTKSPVKVN